MVELMDRQWETKGLDEKNYHSSRKERYKTGGITGENKKMSFFQKNPSYKIFIIDLIFIVIISGVIVPFIYKREGTSTIDNYKMTLRTFDYDDQILLTLTILEQDGVHSNGMVEARFYFKDNNQSIPVARDILPAMRQSRVLKARLPKKSGEYIYCSVTINGQKKIIKKKIK